MRFSWRTACKIAWRESRSSPSKFFFVILAVAVGVGSLTGVRGFSRAFHNMLLRQARTLMAGDISLRVFELPTPQQSAEMDALASAASTAPGSPKRSPWRPPVAIEPPMLVSVKAVDPEGISVLWRDSLVPPAPLRAGPDRRHRGGLRRCAAALEREGRRHDSPRRPAIPHRRRVT